jgi:hypothetical protein
MAALTLAGVTPPADLAIRAQDRIHQALQLTATLDEPAMLATLEQIRSHLQTQDQLMSQLQDGTCTDCEPILLQTREMLHAQLVEAESNIADPDMFRNQNQNQNQNQIRITQTPFATGSAVTPQTSCTPALDGTGQQNGNTNPTIGTPMPQNNGNDQNNNANGSGDGSPNNNEGGNANGSGGDAAPDPSGQGGKP